METLIEEFDLNLREAVEERRRRAVRLKYAQLRMIEVYEELQVINSLGCFYSLFCKHVIYLFRY